MEKSKNYPFGRIIIPTFLSFYLNSLIRYFIPAILPFIILNLHISVLLGSLLITSYWAGYTAFQIPSGMLSDKFGLSLTSKLSFSMIFILFILLYFFINNYLSLMIIQFFLGIFSASLYVSDASLVQAWTPRKERTTAIGIYQTAYFVGASIGEFITIEALNITFKLPFYIIFGFLAAVLLIDLTFIKEPEVRKKSKKQKISRDIIYVTFIRFAAGFSYLGFLSLYSTFIVYSGIASGSNLFLYTWIPSIGGIITSPLGGRISKRFKNGRPLIAAVTVLFLGAIIISTAFIKGYLVILPSFLAGFSYGLYAGPSMGMASDVSGGDRNLASASGIINFSSQVGGSISPFVIGYLFSVYGTFSVPFITLGIISIIFIIPVLFKIKKSSIGDEALNE